MATTNFVDRVTPINASWLNDVDAATYEGAGTYTPAGTGAVARTVQAKLRETVSVLDFGAVADGATDDTAKIIIAANSGAKVVEIPPNTLFNRATLLATLPTNVVCLDWSQINDFTSAGQTTKHVGIITSDIAESDTHWAVDSGHHSIITTNNFGTAGTDSATERKASWLWATGQYALGGLQNRGFRGAAIQQFTKETGATFWKWQIRSIAPWVSIAGDYEDWAQGQVISGAGVYRLGSTSQHYVSTGAGTTGATPPTHTSGTVSDGGVSWTWIDSGDRTLFQCDEYGRWILGSGTTGDATFSHKVSATDPAGNYRFLGASRGASKYANMRLMPTNSGGADSAQPYLQAEDGIGLRVMNSGGTTDLARFSDAGGTLVKEFASSTTSVTSGTSIDVSGIGTLVLNYASPATITAFTGGSDDQIVEVVCQTANLTFTSSATFLLAGSTNLVTPAAWSVFRMKKIPASISDRWIEMSRSLK